MKTAKELAEELEARGKLESAGYRWVGCNLCDGTGLKSEWPAFRLCPRCEGQGGHYEAPLTR